MEHTFLIVSILDPTVIPLNCVGVCDNDGVTTSIEELDRHALNNLMDDPNAYIVRSGKTPMRDFNDPETLMKAHPVLFPYGQGGFVESGEGGMRFLDRVRWCLEYGDRRFQRHRSFLFELFAIEQKRLVCQGISAQVRRSDFTEAAHLVSSITKQDMELAAREEDHGSAITNGSIKRLKQLLKAGSTHILGSDKSRINQRAKLWGLTIRKSAPFLWVTISMNDGHDPIVQVLIGEDIDLKWLDIAATKLPAQKRAHNVVADPYAAAKYFQLVTTAFFEHLLGIQTGRSSIKSRMGVLGLIDAYFGSKETQGRGTLHGHNVGWLEGTPAASKLKKRFEDQDFRHRVERYLEKVICADLKGINPTTIADAKQRQGPNPSFAQPPDPYEPNYDATAKEHLKAIVLNSQIHTCKQGACLTLDRYGQERCK